MQINIRCPDPFIDGFRLHLEDEFEKNGYVKGPKLGYLDSGHMETYLKDEIIVSLQIKESDSGESALHLECEQEIAELKEIWDRAVINYGKDLLQHLQEIAQNPSFVKAELKKI